MGANEYAEYLALMDQHEHLHLDTAMACAEYFDDAPDWAALESHSHRVMFGSDFPIIPYAPNREVHALARNVVEDAALERMLRGTAASLWWR